MDGAKRSQLRELLHAANALLNSMNFAVQSDGDSQWKYAGFKMYMRNFDILLRSVGAILPLPDFMFAFDMRHVPGIGDTIPIQQKEFFEGVHANLSILKSLIESKLDLKADEVTNLAAPPRFHFPAAWPRTRSKAVEG